ncbi:putative membrane protein [Leptospira weilii serovar Ranarum str. ICFT]|uniref:Membrane protein n=1 Tax=Leptospira weilii serovar Ranarum str. ICFT TaxID=1218598 RepID=N1WK20_9LEPT|nr:hypothetical protein [Leptospira weilii]EMY79290.1 putative membrane protein [Leptospira weilii serovar Ranarum str. ICFT]
MKLKKLNEKLKRFSLRLPIRSFLVIFSAGIFFYVVYYTIPESSFASDSLVKILQAKGWIESNFQSQEVHYLGKRLDPDFNFLFVQTIDSPRGDKIAPFPFANTLITVPFVWIGHPEWILYLSALLFGLYTIILNGISKRTWISIVAAIGTPLFHHFISFTDVAVAATLVLSGILILYDDNPLFFGNRFSHTIFSGVLFGFACWYRPEVLILVVCLVSSTFTIKTFSKEGRSHEELKRIFSVSFGFTLSFSIFVLYNFINYDSILGPRISSNDTILDLDFATKISDIQSLLFAGSGRLGLLGYCPWYFFIVLFGIWKWKKTNENVKIWILTFGLNLILVSILTPNDSNIDWGSRYLTCSIFIPLLLLKEIKIPNNPKNIYELFQNTNFLSEQDLKSQKGEHSAIRFGENIAPNPGSGTTVEKPEILGDAKGNRFKYDGLIGKINYKNIILLAFGILIVYTVDVNLRVIKLMRRISVQLARIQSEIPWDSSKVFITRKLNIANTFGLNYISQTILLIKDPKDLAQILRSHPEEKFVLIEDQWDKSLSEFAKNKFAGKLKITKIKNSHGLLRFTEIQSP